MIDITLLRILKHRIHYDSIVPDLPSDALQEKTRFLIKDFGKYLKETGHPVIHIREFKEYFFSLLHPNMSPDAKEYYERMLDNCAKDVDTNTADTMLNRVIELSLATNVAHVVDRYENDAEIEIVQEIQSLLDIATNKITTQEEEIFVTRDIEDLLKDEKETEGLLFRLQTLRRHIKPLRGGDFLIVAGRPDTGKTSFISSEVSHMAAQLPRERPILWFNNEGHGDRIKTRLYQSALGDSIEGLVERSRRKSLHSDYQQVVGNVDQIRIIDCHGWDNKKIEKVIKHMTPGIVILDMIDNIEFKGSRYDARTDQVLEGMYQWARELGVVEDYVTIATSQVSSEAEHTSKTQCYPAMHMLKDSKTGKQGAADIIIMIGRSNEKTLDDIRYLSAPKNKRAKGSGLFAEPVAFDKQTGRYTDRDE